MSATALGRRLGITGNGVRKLEAAEAQQVIRFHHPLVWIHPFPNGNGLHARLTADLLILRLGGKRFSWEQSPPSLETDNRTNYLTALRGADAGSYDDLLVCALLAHSKH